ncbi:MAG: tRNA (uridine(54)-C5)-methyltransferase TrmA [Succinivibrio sp.]|jgi:tRNA (uracil-5-)-methyltransferase|nr:tRNA (uridine(54)-C5)-methyltransferase TrmA [Succinivibrio sp.]
MLKPLLFTVDPENYSAYLDEKITAARTLFKDAGLAAPQPLIFASEKAGFRQRAEFCIFHEQDEDDTFSYVMFEKNGRERLRHRISAFPMASPAINRAMALLAEKGLKYRELIFSLFQAEFLSSQAGQLAIGLDYHRALDEKLWLEQASALRQDFLAAGLDAAFIAHSRKQRIVCGRDWVLETLDTDDGKSFRLYECDGTFTQPNTGVARHMVSFARSCAADQAERDLLELYCGSGTFTVCLSDLFRKALATEVARTPALTARRNLEANGITNVKTARLSADEIAQAMDGVREFKRLKQEKISLGDYSFSTLLIDPPRCGLSDGRALAFTARFDRVIYISCNPQTLCSDLKTLTQTHRIERLAFFDQFPYTPHLESGVLLLKK